MTTFGKTIVAAFFLCLVLSFPFSLTTCAKEKPVASAVNVSAGVCSLGGIWVRCVDDGTSSLRLTMIATDSTFNEKIENFLGNTECSGASDVDISFNSTYSMGLFGTSATIAGGSDFDFIPDSDLGCGPDQPMFTTLKFSDDCSQFFSMQEGPGCVADNRGVSLDPQPFTKQ